VRPSRGESREVAELRSLRQEQPDLAPAIDLQIELVEIQRRIQARVPLPKVHAEGPWVSGELQAGRPIVHFGDIPLDWTDFRLALRQNAEALRRHDAIDSADFERIVALGREGNLLEPLVRSWYAATSGLAEPSGDPPAAAPTPGLEHALVLAMRPFLARCAEVLLARADTGAWERRTCPMCGWEPDFAVITPNGDRRLICGRCVAQWAFDPLACPFCENADRSRITSFATRDGRYRVYGCDVCRRYLKAYDGRNPTRPVMMAVDSVATLPLDAAAMQRGYSG
jgi:FdhE protein